MDQTLKLTPSRRKWILLGVLFILLAAGLALMYAYSPRRDPPDDSLLIVGFMVVFFLVGAIASLLMLSPDRNYLLLTPTGFTVRTLLKRANFRWEEVENFHTRSVKGMTMVVFSRSSQGNLSLTESVWPNLQKAMGGGDEFLPDTYGMGAGALAELMNEWKNRPGGLKANLALETREVRTLANLFAVCVAIFSLASGSCLLAGEHSLTLTGRMDRLFITRRAFFRQRNPLNQPDQSQPIVIEAQRFGSEEVELGQANERMGRLIRGGC